jgi:hypothetical protein
MRDAVQADATLLAWCQANYSKAHTVYKGMDVRQPPPEAHYPIVHLFPVSKALGYGLEKQEHVIAITCGVYDADLDSSTSGGVTLYEYDGIDNLEAMRKLVEAAVKAVVPAGGLIEAMRIEYETIEFFPFLLASMELTISDEYYQGQDVFK